MQTSRPVFVVSIHDVSPLTRERVAGMLDDLAAAGVARTSLLVIPNHHRKAPILEDAGFCQWLDKTAGRGHEVVLHGYYHLRDKVEATSGRLTSSTKRPVGGVMGSQPPSIASTLGLRDRLITEHYTAGEGEFYDLSEQEAAERLERAKGEFARIGLHPRGFIAPAWLLGGEAEKAVKKAGFGYTTRLRNFKDLTTGRVIRSQSLVWSTRAPWRRAASLWWNATLARRLRHASHLRFGLHPPDWDFPAIRRQIIELIRAALAEREAITYEDWLSRSRGG